jgi:ATP adenylyltransferase
MEYIQAAKDQGEGWDECLFCSLATRTDDAEAYVLARGEASLVVLNAFPYNPGHLMVAPYRHVADLDALDEREVADTGRLIQRCVVVLREEMQPHGFNVGMNLGRVAGAGIPGHLHWHVVPRWNGDTNFMPVVGETRVLPESLDATYAKLAPRF